MFQTIRHVFVNTDDETHTFRFPYYTQRATNAVKMSTPVCCDWKGIADRTNDELYEA